jgi:tetratricopeptide (TPR) repeat protein
MNEHYTADELMSVSVESDPIMEKHLEVCESCRSERGEATEFEAALCDPLAWSVADSLTQPSAVPPSWLRERIEGVDRGAELARTLIQPTLVSPIAFRQADISHLRAFWTPEVVLFLCDAAREIRDRQPQFAVLVATTATEIAEKLDRTQGNYSAVFASAWLARGIACGAMAEYRDGDTALSRAEHAYRQSAASTTWDLANVWLSQANIRVETERLDEALNLAGAAATAYFSYGDVHRGLRALLVRGSVLYLRGEFTAGIAIYEQVLAHAHLLGEQDTIATALHNMANCYLGAGDWQRARSGYIDALARWDAMGVHTQQVRAFWSLATIDIASGDFDGGLHALEDVRRQLVALGLINDEALVRLEMAEALIAMGRHAEVPSLLDGIAVKFATDGMMRNAKVALAYLSEVLSRQRLSSTEIRHVRSYLERLPTHPQERFSKLA